MKAAVLGSPVAHSLSPVLHRAAYAALGLEDWTYQAIECDEARLPELIASRRDGWAGLSLTMPLKRAVLPLLDHIEPLAAEVGAANTVVFAGGSLHGHNTDVPGMVAALTGAGALSVPGRATILGGGATACSALAALRALGLRTMVVAVRDPARAAGLAAAARRLGVRAELRPFAEHADRGGELLISTVPAEAADIYAERIRRGSYAPGAVFDVLYHPWPTPLAAAARDRGAVVVGGFDLLLHQAAGQVELMTGKTAPVESMREAGLAELECRAAARAVG